MADPITVVFCVDDANLKQVAVVIASIRRSAAPTTRHVFHVLYDGAGGGTLQAFQRAVRGTPVSVHRISHGFDKYTPVGHLSPAALMRLMIPDVIPDVPRAIYMDADLIVRRDLAALFDVDLGDALMAGVIDYGMYALIAGEGTTGADRMLRHMRDIVGLDPQARCYVNSGMLVMDLERMRAESFTQRAIAIFEARGEAFIWRDQDLINSMLGGHVKLLDPRWNVLTFFMLDAAWMGHLPGDLRAAQALQQAEQWIIHYTAAYKPWNSTRVWKPEYWWEAARDVPLHFKRPREEAPHPAIVAVADVYRRAVPEPVRGVVARLRLALWRLARGVTRRR